MGIIKLSEISNLKLDEGARKLSPVIYEFIVSLVSDYYLTLTRADSGSDLYPSIKKYFLGGEISSKKLIGLFCSDSELAPLIEEFPVSSDGSFNYLSWDSFFSHATIDIQSNEHCIFSVNGHKYEITLRLLAFVESGTEYVIQRYFIDSEGNPKFRNLGDGEGVRSTGNPFRFGGKQSQIDDPSANDSIEISSEEFFELNDTIKSADDEQKYAIKSGTDKNLIIVAGAGSGKTRTLVCRLAYLHLVNRIPLSKILLLTFTNNAADEMRRRCIEFVNPIYGLVNPLTPPRINARTIDSFFLNLLETYYVQIGFPRKPTIRLDGSEDVQKERLRILDEVIHENKMIGVFKYYYDYNNSTGTSTLNKSLLSDLTDYACGVPINRAGLDALLRLYLDKQRQENLVLGFTEVSLFIKDAMQDPSSSLRDILLNRYSCILIDEFQDVNVLQNSIFEVLYDSSIHFTFVGDDDQSIYFWRGSDSGIIRRQLNNDRVNACYLLTNYRNNPNIVEAGNDVLRTIKDRAKSDKPIRANRQTGSKVRVATYDDKYLKLQNEVSRLLRNGQEPSEICILSRNGFTASQISDVLTAANIPVAKASAKIDITDNYKLMKAIINIACDCDITASAKEIKRITGANRHTELYIKRLVLGKNSSIRIKKELQPVVELGRVIRQIPEGDDLANVVYRYSLKAAELFENTTNERHSDPVFSYFEEFCKNNDAPWPVVNYQLKELFNLFEIRARNERQKKQETENGVRVSTIHGVKGLEYNVVIITGLSDGNYPSTEQVEKTIRIRTRQLETFAESRRNYLALKNASLLSLIGSMESQCLNDTLPLKEQRLLSDFYYEVKSLRTSLAELTADGVEEFVDSYRNYVLPIDKYYQDLINEKDNLILVKQTAIETFEDRLDLLNSANANKNDIEENAVDGEEDTDISSILEKLSVVQEEMISLEEEKKAIERQRDSFENSIPSIRQMYNTCLQASGFLADMEKADEIEVLRKKLQEEKEQRINEERRLFYVAVTRARDFLYLCYEEGKKPSEFITIIRPELKTIYKMMTRSEEHEYHRITQELHQEASKTTVDEPKFQEAQDKLLNSDYFKGYISKRELEFAADHPFVHGLSEPASEYFKQAIGLLFISEMTGSDFRTEFAHNIQRAIETQLNDYAGHNACPYYTNSSAIADTIASDIRRITRQGKTHPPSRRYIVDLLMNTDERKDQDNMTQLKSAGIIHYAVRSKKYEVDTSISSTWEHKEKLNGSDSFLVAANDLANTRNELIHRDRDQWPEDPIPEILKNAECVIRNCTIADASTSSQGPSIPSSPHLDNKPKAQASKPKPPVTESPAPKIHQVSASYISNEQLFDNCKSPKGISVADIRVGTKVIHRYYGKGKIVLVRDDLFTVRFERSSELSSFTFGSRVSFKLDQ